jgi:hypothetical protein
MQKKIYVIGIMVLLLCSIASAVDLSDYPNMFIKGLKLNVYLVVGKSAAAEDVVGSIDIASSLVKASPQKEFESIAKLDEEILDNLTDYNTILVGGPCANSATAKIMGYPKDCTEGFKVGNAVIRLYEHENGNVALVVAGLLALDTRRATSVLADYTNPNYNLTGTELIVKGVGQKITGTSNEPIE